MLHDAMQLRGSVLECSRSRSGHFLVSCLMRSLVSTIRDPRVFAVRKSKSARMRFYVIYGLHPRSAIRAFLYIRGFPGFQTPSPGSRPQPPDPQAHPGYTQEPLSILHIEYTPIGMYSVYTTEILGSSSCSVFNAVPATEVPTAHSRKRMFTAMRGQRVLLLLEASVHRESTRPCSCIFYPCRSRRSLSQPTSAIASLRSVVATE